MKTRYRSCRRNPSRRPVICGCSASIGSWLATRTNQADVVRLIGGEVADLVFTDPPYNVDYEGYTEQRLKIKGDRMSDADFKRFLEVAFRSLRTAVKPGASLYVCHSSSWQREFQNALESAGFQVRCQLIWAKNTFAWGFGRYKFRHEPLFYCHVSGQKDPWHGDKTQSTLWEEKKPAANRIHPTTKPVELIERALLNSSKTGDVVADFFGGSGSTLIACERRGRRARLMEIDPKYADCIVRRFQEYSGKSAVLDCDGRTFEVIAKERTEEWARIERCRREIADIAAQILAGHTDVQGLCLALSDWSAELRILQNEKRRQAEAQRRDIAGKAYLQAFSE